MTNETDIIRDFRVLRILDKLSSADLEEFLKSADTGYLKDKAKIILINRELKE